MSLTDGISRALGQEREDFDIDAIAEDLRQAGVESVDDVPGETFWAIVARHGLPEYEEEADLLGQFKAEMVQAFKTKAGVPALWTRGGVSLEVEGHSRVSTAMPQPMARYRLTVAGGQTVQLAPDEVASWLRLWETVESALTAWTSAVQDRRRVYDAALRAEEDARAALFGARTAVERAQRELAAVLPPGEAPAGLTMSRDEVAEYLGIAPGSVAKQMNRWGINPEYERGPYPRRPQARYPRALVQARAAARPGRGHRSDLD